MAVARVRHRSHVVHAEHKNGDTRRTRRILQRGEYFRTKGKRASPPSSAVHYVDVRPMLPPNRRHTRDDSEQQVTLLLPPQARDVREHASTSESVEVSSEQRNRKFRAAVRMAFARFYCKIRCMLLVVLLYVQTLSFPAHVSAKLLRATHDLLFVSIVDGMASQCECAVVFFCIFYSKLRHSFADSHSMLGARNTCRNTAAAANRCGPLYVTASSSADVRTTTMRQCSKIMLYTHTHDKCHHLAHRCHAERRGPRELFHFRRTTL